ncbi:carbohydrate-binding domain-containing protein [Siccirubricoccus deserti]
MLKISQDAWQGNATYTISVDGKQVDGTLTAGASHAAGLNDVITVKGNWGAGAHKVTVNFTNDAYGGSSAADRNLHVDGITFNGVELAGSSADLYSNGPADFAFSKAAVVTPPPVAEPPVTTTPARRRRPPSSAAGMPMSGSAKPISAGPTTSPTAARRIGAPAPGRR